MHSYGAKMRNESAQNEDIAIVFVSNREVMEQLLISFLMMRNHNHSFCHFYQRVSQNKHLFFISHAVVSN